MKYILILAISTVLLLKSSIQSDDNHPHTYKHTKKIIIFFHDSFHGDDMKTILEKSLLEYSPHEIHSLTLKNVSTGEIFKNFSFNNFEKLNDLYIEDGQINNFPVSTFEGLKELYTLALLNIGLKSVPANLSKFIPTITNLYLENNAIEYIPDDYFKNFNTFWRIILTSNNLTTLPTGIFNFASKNGPYDIFLNNNRIKTLKKDVFVAKLLKTLNLSHNNVSHIDKNTFEKLPNLVTINMTATFNAEVVNLPKELFSNLSKLQTIIMTRNYLQSLEVGIFQTLQELEDLDLSFNKFKTLPGEIFEDNIHLRKLNLSNNRLQSLSK